MSDFDSYRRHCLRKRLDAKDRSEFALVSLWRTKQEAEPGTVLPDDFPSREELAAIGYETKEDLEGADAEELADYVGLSPHDAERVIAAHAAL